MTSPAPQQPAPSPPDRPTTMDRPDPSGPALRPARLDAFLHLPTSQRPRATGGHTPDGAALLEDRSGVLWVQDPDCPAVLHTPQAWQAAIAAIAVTASRVAADLAAASAATSAPSATPSPIAAGESPAAPTEEPTAHE